MPPKTPTTPLKIAFFGSGAFGIPTLQFLEDHPETCRLTTIISQPDRPAGRGRKLTPTPVADWAQNNQPRIPNINIIKTENTNNPEIINQTYQPQPDIFIVIAFGQKLKPQILQNTFAINLHASLLPKYRGAAPINHAIINNESQTGASVITLADRMDAGDILASASLPIRQLDTAAELHDQLAQLGPDLIKQTLSDFLNNTLNPIKQDESQATLAPKLIKAEGTTHFHQPAEFIRAQIHGLNPWPGCTVLLHINNKNTIPIKIGLVRDHPQPVPHKPGHFFKTDDDKYRIACKPGSLEILKIQPAGKKMMNFSDYVNAHEITPDADFVMTKPIPLFP